MVNSQAFAFRYDITAEFPLDMEAKTTLDHAGTIRSTVRLVAVGILRAMFLLLLAPLLLILIILTVIVEIPYHLIQLPYRAYGTGIPERLKRAAYYIEAPLITAMYVMGLLGGCVDPNRLIA